jgi:hypothetical protein
VKRREPEARDPETGLPIISTPGDRRGNGKRWALETIGKAVGVVLGAVLLGVLTFIATGKAYAIYGLPPRVDALELKVYAPPSPMSQTEIDRLAAAIVAALPAQPAKKGKP